jgi:hypothetical protein
MAWILDEYSKFHGHSPVESLKNHIHTSERKKKIAAMFPGMFMRKPDKAEALKQLRTHVALFGSWVVIIRAAPYVLSYFSDSKDELKIDF